jgi:nucleoside-diphosphate-sugar epimerase
MNVFLTGATGYIGGAIADALQLIGHTVLGLAHSEKSAHDRRMTRSKVTKEEEASI